MSHKLWDFDEDKNFISFNGYKVLKIKEYNKASKLLRDIDAAIIKAFIHLELSKKTRDKYINLLLDTPYHLQEMQLIKDQKSIKFEGLNKPKIIYKSNKEVIGPDKQLRARHRLIFLTLRKNDRILTLIEMLPLVAHELTHTALNHVTWRDDDHDYPFNKYNKIILDALLI